MTISTYRFGEITVDEGRKFVFPQGIPGFESLHQYLLVDPEETHPVIWLQSVEDGSVTIPVIHTFRIIEDYVFDAQDEDVDRIALDDMGDLLVLNVVVLPEDLTKMTVNLAAPILINLKKGLGVQAIIEQSPYAIREPAFERIVAYLQKEDAGHAGTHAQDR